MSDPSTPPPGTPKPLAGLLPDPPDSRDKDMLDLPAIQALAQRPGTLLHSLGVRAQIVRPPSVSAMGMLQPMAGSAPPLTSLSLRADCGPVQDQGALNACTAHAAAALMELVECHLNKRALQGSRMVLYKVSRNILQWTGDSGAFLRTVAGALTLFGLPPEKYWPYDTTLLDTEPTPFCYQLGQHYHASSYFRIDSDGVAAQAVIDRIKSLLEQGLPSMFGYIVYFGAEFQAQASGGIPLPIATDLKVGGHALMICGFDDKHVITNTSTGGATSTGAFQIQNSRGTGWGDQGFGYIPYDYFLQGLATDVWSIVNMDWVNLQSFDQGPTAPSTGADG
jgi:C1A family cysteine protease